MIFIVILNVQVDAITEQIAYPDFIKIDEELNNFYADVSHSVATHLRPVILVTVYIRVNSYDQLLLLCFVHVHCSWMLTTTLLILMLWVPYVSLY